MGRDARAGVIGRQIARRLVERFADDAAAELRPVFLVAMPEAKSDAGYLVFGSTPDADLAARYGESLGTTHALTGLYREDGARRALAVTLIDVATRRPVAQRELAVAQGELHRAEPALAAWLAGALGIPTSGRDEPEAVDEKAYLAFLEGLDEEVNATLLRSGDEVAAAAARRRAFERYVTAVRADPGSARAEERLLVLAAESVERGDEELGVRALEEIIEVRPRSWRAHYMLAELRREIGETSGAIVALEHAHALRPLRDADVVVLAELYVAEGAPGQAAAHLRRIAPSSDVFGQAQELLGALAMGKGDHPAAITHFERAAANGRTSARAHLARAQIAAGRREEARRELAEILLTGADPDTAAQARRLRLGIERPDLEAELERAGRAALAADTTSLDEVRSSFQSVLAFDPELWEAHFGVGLVARRREDFAGAAGSFRRALELAPGQADVMHELGVALLASGAKAEALTLLDGAAALRPREAAYIADAGFAHLRAGDLGAARERLRIASGIDADDPLTRAYLDELERAEAAAGKAN
jgi:Tfp pilus assembly protein PilF